MYGAPKTGVRREHVQAEGLDFCHFCSESGPEARLGFLNTQTQFLAAGSTRQLSPGSQSSLAQGSSSQWKPISDKEANDHPQSPKAALDMAVLRSFCTKLMPHTLFHWLFKILPA